MRSLVGPVPEPAERAGSALRRCGRGTLTFGADVSAIRPAAADTAARPNEGTTPVTADVRLAHHAPGTADVWVAVPMADAAMITRGAVHARLEVLEVISGGAAAGRCRRVVVEGSAELPGIRAQRHVATHIAEELPDSVLLGVGGDVALVRLRADRIVLTDH